MRASTPFILMTLACLSAASADSPLKDGIHREGDTLIRVYRGEKFTIDQTTVSIKLNDPSTSFAEFVGQLAEPAIAQPGTLRVADLTLLRSNRLGWHDLRLPAGTDLLSAMEQLRAIDGITLVEEATIGTYTAVPNDPRFDDQWAMQNTGQTGGTSGADMNAVAAWDIQAGDSSVWVAVVDSGTNYNHTDLSANMWKNPGEIEGNGIDDDGNGFTDDYHGWNFDGNNNNPQTSGSHGTMVAGCIAATGNNGIGISGLAGGNGDDSGVLMMPLAVGSFGPNGSVVDDAIIYAADNGAKVITMSLSISSSNAVVDAVEYATEEKGCLVLCAAGNNGSSVGFPASIDRVMAIGATDHNDNPANFTNPGPEVEVSAPGVDVLTTSLSGGYEETSGTSFSAPYTAALAALIWSEAPCFTNAEVRQLIIDTSDDVHSSGFDNLTGWGRINAGNALAALATACCPADSNGDGVVDLADLNEVLAHFGEGTTPPIGPNPVIPEAGDLNGDNRVDLADLNIVLAGFGLPCE
ncbi:MAG: S8 family serine peptidase [Phycisphaerales bacterium JB065]